MRLIALISTMIFHVIFSFDPCSCVRQSSSFSCWETELFIHANNTVGLSTPSEFQLLLRSGQIWLPAQADFLHAKLLNREELCPCCIYIRCTSEHLVCFIHSTLSCPSFSHTSTHTPAVLLSMCACWQPNWQCVGQPGTVYSSVCHSWRTPLFPKWQLRSI